ncbi:MAG: DUF1367 family protein [Helicobacteraceae bacterium]|nr:DUF1367 family protein [Helicobacteraceae bacterium]
MQLLLKRIEQGFMPLNDESVKATLKIKEGDEIYVEYKPRRSYKFHKKYWALLNAVLYNQEHYKSVDNIHEAVKYRAGYYETIIPLIGDPFIVTKSISFHTMDAIDFESFYNVAIDICVELTDDEAVEQIIKFN